MFSKKNLILFSLSAVLSIPSFANEVTIKERSLKAIQTVAGSLQTSLMQKIKEGGFSNAAKFCSINASSLGKKASKSLPEGVKLKRITNKPRNIKNLASSEQLVVLEQIKSKLANGEKVDMVVKQKSENHYQVYAPIMIKKPCLNCHGNDTTRDKEAYNIISKKYPNDKAIGYKLGDFRGAFLVDIRK